MKLIKIILLFLFFLTLPISSCVAHLCDNIYREPDRLVVKPERQMVRLEKTGSLGIYMKNTYPAPLHNLRLVGESSAFEVEVEPVIIEVLNPEEKIYLLVKLTLKKGIEPGSYPLLIKVGAKQFELRPAMQIDIQKEKGPEPIGEVMIQVERFAQAKYYLWLLPILFLLIILIYRKFKVK